MKNMSCKIILYLWQLPQNLLGLAVILFCGAVKEYSFTGYEVWSVPHCFGVSLGRYVIVFANAVNYIPTLRHEAGHCKQSLYLGWLYLIVIGVPSFVGNIIHRFFKFNYYHQLWEAWADKLGGVKR